MTKYYVVAIKWSSTKNKQIEKVIGEFDDYMNAIIFKQAYYKIYSCSPKIVEVKL